jgi:3-oxoadipate enol-lactonase
MFDQGDGAPLVVVPGVQGRWEWMAPALRELAKHGRTIAYSLSGDSGSGMPFDAARGFDSHVEQLDAVFAAARVERAALCGVSYGGFIALRYAALRPERVSHLVLASSPAPGWVPDDRQQKYIASPWRSTPRFVVSGPLRLWPEIQAAYDTWGQRLAFSGRHALRLLAAPIRPPLMAARVRLQQGIDFAPDCRRILAPTLVITGEDALDRIVPVEVTRRYATLIAGAQYVKMERTGHIGLVTRPARFAEIIAAFMAATVSQPSTTPSDERCRP